MARQEQHKQRGPNSRFDIRVELADFYNGTTKHITINKNVVCNHCHGTGGKLGNSTTCPRCHGKGQVLQEVNTGMGYTFNVQNTCPKCRGKGMIFKERCPHCSGRKIVKEQKTLEVTIEKGMKDQDTVVFPRESEQHPDMIPGDLIVNLRQMRHSFFYLRKGDDLFADISLNMKEALLGFSRFFTHLDDRKVNVSKTTTTQPFEVMELKGEGMPIHNYSSNKGKLHLKLNVRLPTHLTEEEKKMIEDIL